MREFFVEHRCYAVLVVIVDRGGGGFAEGAFGAHERDGRGVMRYGAFFMWSICCVFQDHSYVFINSFIRIYFPAHATTRYDFLKLFNTDSGNLCCF